MKKNIGTNLALYPTPLVVVGTMVDGKPNYTLVGHRQFFFCGSRQCRK